MMETEVRVNAVTLSIAGNHHIYGQKNFMYTLLGSDILKKTKESAIFI